MDTTLQKIQTRLEEIKRINQGLEYWSARDLMSIFGYSEWRKFSAVVEKAKQACENSDQVVHNHFVDADKMVLTGSGASRIVNDHYMTRYGCYLIAQNGDPRKNKSVL